MPFKKKKVVEKVEEPVATAQPDPVPEETGKWTVKEVATQTQPMLVNESTGEQLEVYQALAKILNAIEE